jgi:transposase-like protein
MTFLLSRAQPFDIGWRPATSGSSPNTTGGRVCHLPRVKRVGRTAYGAFGRRLFLGICPIADAEVAQETLCLLWEGIKPWPGAGPSSLAWARSYARGAAGLKQAIVAAAFAPGAVVRDVARRADVTPSLIYRWRRDLRAAATGFVRVLMAPGGDGIAAPSPMSAIEIRICGQCPRSDPGISVAGFGGRRG